MLEFSMFLAGWRSINMGILEKLAQELDELESGQWNAEKARRPFRGVCTSRSFRTDPGIKTLSYTR
jgi:hypothetical protein